MVEVKAPYNFVPLSGRVVTVGRWAGEISHDMPRSDGISGSIVLSLEAITPLCVGGEMRKEQHQGSEHEVLQPFAVDGKPAILGSALRGMLRNVVEIASFSGLRLTDPGRQDSVRDLTNRELYLDTMDRATAGWLEVTEKGAWQIRPCTAHRIRHSDLLAALANRPEDQAAFRAATRTSGAPSSAKYEAWGGELEVTFGLQEGEVDLAGQGHSGVLVFTGQPNTGPRAKSREFVFEVAEGPAIDVPDKVKRAFEAVHSEERESKHGTEA